MLVLASLLELLILIIPNIPIIGTGRVLCLCTVIEHNGLIAREASLHFVPQYNNIKLTCTEQVKAGFQLKTSIMLLQFNQ